MVARKSSRYHTREMDLFFWISAVTLLALASSRAWLGESRDYLEYLRYYDTIMPTLSFQDTRFEPGFHLASWIFSIKLGLPFWILAFSVIAPALAIKAYLFSRYLTYPKAAFLVYVATFFPNQEYTQIRVALAISLGLLSIHLLRNRRILWSLLAFAVAFTFHYSIVIFIAVYLAAQFLKPNVLSGVAASLGLVFILILTTGDFDDFVVAWFAQLNPLVVNYVDNIAAIEAASILSLNNLLVVAIFIAAVSAGWLKRDDYQKCFTIMFGSSVLFVVVFSDAPIIAVRVKEMLLVALVFAAFRHPIDRLNILPIALVYANAALLLYLAIREGVILGAM